jgi:ABC-2 type transport system permease protein
VLPFKCIYAIPLTIYISKLSPNETMNGIVLQVFWLALLVLLGRFVWRRAYSHLTVQGG